MSNEEKDLRSGDQQISNCKTIKILSIIKVMCKIIFLFGSILHQNSIFDPYIRMIMKKFSILLLFIGIYITSCNSTESKNTGETAMNNYPSAPPLLNFSIINIYPHDTASFTQGLAFYKGQLYESTGSPENIPNNGSWLGPVNLQTGKSQKKIALSKEFFGEGMTFLNDKIYQITWQNHKGFVYDAVTFKKLKEFSYANDGWGLTNDGKNIIMSDGSSILYYLLPDSLTVTKKIEVLDNNGSVPNLNELEYINGFVYANQWETAYVLKIDPTTGNVVGKFDFSKLVNEIKAKDTSVDVLNGIAYDSTTHKIFITGKKWPSVYEVRF
jgi:glutamine cyclotransferase